MKVFRDLLKHSAVYAVGQILTRMASILLLPLYTHCLSTEDYGVTAILDLTTTILSLMIGGGMAAAVSRYHFDADDESHHDRVWWTGMTFVAIAGAFILAPLWIGRQLLADLTLGTEVVSGGWFYTLALANTWFYVVGHIADTYLRVRKWSGTFVVISFGRLLLNIGLNVWFLVGLDLGVEGLLLGNLTAGALHTLALLVVFARSRGRYTFDTGMLQSLWRYSAPMIATSLLAMLMHEADRYVLRTYRDLGDVGVYSLAHKIGFAVNTLCLMPFQSIWHVAIYDIERLPNANAVFGRAFRWFVSGLGILLLGAALTVHPIIPLLTPDTYGEAIDLISVILLGFFCFGLIMQFEVPALLSKRTGLTVPGSFAGVVVNLSANFLLIPHYGAWGAAWAGVLTYLVFSFVTLAMCRQVTVIPYPWKSSGLTVAGLCVTYVALRYGVFPVVGPWTQIGLSVLVCAVWAAGLLSRDALNWWVSRRTRIIHSDETTPPVDNRPAVETDGVSAASTSGD